VTCLPSTSALRRPQSWMRVDPDSSGGIGGNDTETLLGREGNTRYEESARMSDNLTLDAQGPELVLRCECGALIVARGERRLVDLARLHFGEFHPDLGAAVPADLILAMAEQKENQP
jgi:hypothetical protein